MHNAVLEKWADFKKGYAEIIKSQKKEDDKELKALERVIASERKSLLSEQRKVLSNRKKSKDPGNVLISIEELEAEQANELIKFEREAGRRIQKVKDKHKETIRHLNKQEECEAEFLLDEEYAVSKLEDMYVTKIIKLTKCYHDNFSNINPWYSEKKFEVSLGEGYPNIKGVFDLVEHYGIIVDSKTASSAPMENDIHEDIQMSLYDMCYRILFGSKPKQLVKRWVIDTKDAKVVEQRAEARSDEQLQRVLNRIRLAMDCIASGVFLPAPQGSWVCSRKWCGYWEDCNIKP